MNVAFKALNVGDYFYRSEISGGIVTQRLYQKMEETSDKYGKLNAKNVFTGDFIFIDDTVLVEKA